MGVMLSAAGSLQWYKDTFAAAMDYDSLLAEAAAVPAGQRGTFLPALSDGRAQSASRPAGAGAPSSASPAATAAGHMTRAVLEGVAFGLKDSFTLIDQVGLPEEFEVRISGGGAKSPVWQQIIADVLGAPLVNVNITEGGGFWARRSWLRLPRGVFDDVASACAAMIQTGESVTVGENAAIYAERYGIYQSLYPTLQQTFARL